MGRRVGGYEVLRSDSGLHFFGEVHETLEVGVGLRGFDVSKGYGDFRLFGFSGLFELMDLLIFCRNDLLQVSDFAILGRYFFLKFLPKLIHLPPISLLIKLPSSLTLFLPQLIPQQHLFQLQVNNHLPLQLTFKFLHPLLLLLILLVDLVPMQQQVDLLLQLHIGMRQFLDGGHALSIYLFFSENLVLQFLILLFIIIDCLILPS